MILFANQHYLSSLTYFFVFVALDIYILEMQRTCFQLQLKGEIDKILLYFCAITCSSWFSMILKHCLLPFKFKSGLFALREFSQLKNLLVTLDFIFLPMVNGLTIELLKEIQNTRRGQYVFRTLCCDVFGLLKDKFCLTTIIKIVNNNTNDKQTSGISGVR